MDEANNGHIDIYNAFAWEPRWWNRKVTFVYVDTTDYKADNLIEKRGIRIKYLEDAKKDDMDYCICACRIPKKQIGDFLDAMYELQNLMLICGHLDYEEVCGEVRKMLMEDEDDD